MRVVSDLTKLHDAVQTRLSRLGGAFATISGRPPEDRNFVIAACVIELDNLSMSAVRQFTVSSLTRARTVLGHRVTVNRTFGSEEEISAYLLSVLNSVAYARAGSPSAVKFDKEPKVRDPKDTEKVLISCGATNLPSLQNALALNVGLFRDVATIRNFYAHRNRDTFRKVRAKALNMGVATVKHTDELVQAHALGRPVSVFQDWLSDAQVFFEELMK
jgi:hypothetical protein